jgi:hypothetical protein
MKPKRYFNGGKVETDPPRKEGDVFVKDNQFYKIGSGGNEMKMTSRDVISYIDKAGALVAPGLQGSSTAAGIKAKASAGIKKAIASGDLDSISDYIDTNSDISIGGLAMRPKADKAEGSVDTPAGFNPRARLKFR